MAVFGDSPKNGYIGNVVVIIIQTHTHLPSDCFPWITKVAGNNFTESLKLRGQAYDLMTNVLTLTYLRIKVPFTHTLRWCWLCCAAPRVCDALLRILPPKMYLSTNVNKKMFHDDDYDVPVLSTAIYFLA